MCINPCRGFFGIGVGRLPASFRCGCNRCDDDPCGCGR